MTSTSPAFPRHSAPRSSGCGRIIRATAPDAEECISYQIPAFKLHGKGLIWFGAAAHHCAIYGVANDPALKDYDTSGKGTLRFTVEKPLPDALVRKLVKSRMKKIAAKADRARVTRRTRLSACHARPAEPCSVTMIGVLGILVSLALLMYLAYRGINVLILAPLLSLLAVVAGSDTRLLATFTQVYMTSLGGFVAKYFPLFLLGAIFGRLMSDSGSASSIARSIVRKLGPSQAPLALVLACGILTYGGVSVFVVVFAAYPVAAQLFRAANTPKRLIPGGDPPGRRHVHAERHSRHAVHPERDADGLLRHRCLRRAWHRQHRRHHHAGARHAVAEPPRQPGRRRG